MRGWKGVAIAALAIFAAASIAWAAGKMMSVAVKEARVREKPHVLGKTVAVLAYGDRVKVVDEQGAWVNVSLADGRAGWMHVSALSANRIVLRPGAADVKASASGAELALGAAGARTSGEEIALAGKGFNDRIEAEFRAKHRDVDYAPVDRMEKTFIFTPEEIGKFLEEGGLLLREGGGK